MVRKDEGMKLEQIKVTPAKAAEWLAKNTKNRGLSPCRVDSIARDITEGRWSVAESITAPIMLHPDGTLANGQHRLSAIVKANKPVMAWVVMGLPADTRIDNVRARTLADNLKMGGVKNAASIAAIARLCVSYAVSQISGIPSQSEMQMAIEGLGLTACTSNIGRLTSPYGISGVHAVWAMARTTMPEQADEFMEQYITGTNLGQASPVLVLRSRLARDKASRQDRTVSFNLCAAAWNAFSEHRPLLQIKSEIGTLLEVNGAKRDAILGRILGVSQ